MRNLLFGAGATRTLYDVPAVIAPQKTVVFERAPFEPAVLRNTPFRAFGECPFMRGHAVQVVFRTGRRQFGCLLAGAGGYARSHAAQIERLPFTLIIFSDDLVAIAGQASDRLTQFDSVPNDFCDRSRVGRNPQLL